MLQSRRGGRILMRVVLRPPCKILSENFRENSRNTWKGVLGFTGKILRITMKFRQKIENFLENRSPKS